MVGASVGGDLKIKGTAFESGCKCDRLQVLGRVDATAQDDTPVTFGADALFRDARFTGEIDFGGAQFKGDTSFNRSRVGGLASFSSSERGGRVTRVTFQKEARFTAVSFDADVNFRGAQFTGKADFDRSHIQGSAYFSPDSANNRAQFAEQLLFKNVHCDGELSFRSASFAGRADFYALDVGGGLLLHPAMKPDECENERTKFAALVSFRRAKVAGEANFFQVEFNGATPTPGRANPGGSEWGTTFNAAHFAHVTFVEARFIGRTNFEACLASEWMNLSGAEFSSHVSFREAEFRTVFFRRMDGDLPTKIGRTVDLRGCTYARIYVDSEILSDKLAADFAPQPYRQLEAALRASGLDQAADAVYLRARQAERAHSRKVKDYFRWIRAAAYGWVARYGVRPLRLIVIPIILLGVGTVAFLQPGALEWKGEAKNPHRASVPTIGPLRALGVSAGQLLPIELPICGELQPSMLAVHPDLAWLTFEGLAGC